jgi:hypothetical protein
MATQFPGPLGVGAQKPSTAAANQRHRRSHRMLGSADDAVRNPRYILDLLLPVKELQ